MKLLNPCAPVLKPGPQQVPFGLRPELPKFSAMKSTPFTLAYVAEIATVPSSWRMPKFICVDFGIFDSLSINHASGRPDVWASASSVALSAVRYESFQATYPAGGVTPLGANRT